MDLTSRLKRLPIDKSKPILEIIRNNIINNDVINKKINSVKAPNLNVDNDIDLDKNYNIGENEYRLVTEVWSKGKTCEFPKMTTYQLFEEQVIKNPHKNAVIFNDKSLSYTELNNKANKLAHYLNTQGVHQETIVAVFLERSLDMIITILAILKAGGAYLPIDPSYPKDRVNQILEDSQAGLVITNDKLSKNINNVNLNTKLIKIEMLEKQILTTPSQNPKGNVNLNNLAYVIYTSGSTGTPKGVMIEHRSLTNFIFSISKEYEITKNDVIIQFASIGFDVSVFDIFTSLCNGATLCIASEEERKSPEKLTELMRKYGVTVAELPPALLPLLNPKDFPMLRLLSVGGEKFSGDLVSIWSSPKRRFVNGYGPTETTVAVTLFDCKGKWNTNPPIGKPMYNIETYVLNNNLQPVPIGVPGELYIGGACLARGYLNRNELNSQRFVNNPFSNDKNSKLYKTGDLVRWLPDGNLEILGRSDRQIKIRGFRVELEEIESNLIRLPNIKQAVVDVSDEINNDIQIIAYIVLEKGAAIDIKELRESLKGNLPSYMVPSRFIEIDEIPLTPNGKIDRKSLPRPSELIPESSNHLLPRDETELMICDEILCPILGVKNIGINDNFFDLGGNSLQATMVVSQIRNRFDVDINLIDFFQSPTVENLANLVKQKETFNKNKRKDLIRELNEIEQSWLKVHEAPQAKYRIVCFPYAGASGYLFKRWPELLAPDFEIITIDLPGHGTKIKEKPFDSAFEVANRLASEIELYSDKPLIFLGHSGGAILAFETCRILLKKGIRINRLFALASRAPHVELKDPPRYHLPDSEFLTRVNEFGGLSDELLKNKELLSLMIPTMRADEKLAETYLYKGELKILPFPISIYGGKDDRIEIAELEDWTELSSANCEIKLFDGGHFFLQEHEDIVLYSIIETIAQATTTC